MGDAAQARERLTIEAATKRSTLDIEDVADLLDVPVKTAYALAQRRKIPGRIAELGRLVRFRAAVVVAWLQGADGASGRSR